MSDIAFDVVAIGGVALGAFALGGLGIGGMFALSFEAAGGSRDARTRSGSGPRSPRP